MVAEALRAPVFPDLSTLAQIGLAAAPGVLGPGMPLALAVGISAAARRQRADGEWTALRAAGVRGRAFLPGALVLALGAGLALASHRVSLTTVLALAAGCGLVSRL